MNEEIKPNHSQIQCFHFAVITVLLHCTEIFQRWMFGGAQIYMCTYTECTIAIVKKTPLAKANESWKWTTIVELFSISRGFSLFLSLPLCMYNWMCVCVHFSYSKRKRTNAFVHWRELFNYEAHISVCWCCCWHRVVSSTVFLTEFISLSLFHTFFFPFSLLQLPNVFCLLTSILFSSVIRFTSFHCNVISKAENFQINILWIRMSMKMFSVTLSLSLSLRVCVFFSFFSRALCLSFKEQTVNVCLSCKCIYASVVVCVAGAPRGNEIRDF